MTENTDGRCRSGICFPVTRVRGIVNRPQPPGAQEATMTIVFVHGITVRRDRLDRLLSDVKQGLRRADCGNTVAAVYWGDLGRSDGYSGRTVPGSHAGQRGIQDVESVIMPPADVFFDAKDGDLLFTPIAELAGLRDPTAF